MNEREKSSMPRYVKNESDYGKVSFEATKIKTAARKARASRKQPTSVALPPQLIADLKAAAKARGVPYQVLMRMFIVEGFNRLNEAG
jgi:predicted DNA binding CopG/RHH family protein